MARIPLAWPRLGLNDAALKSKQPVLSTVDAGNVRNRDPISGELIGAQRSGTEKFSPTKLDVSGSTRVQRLAADIYPNPGLITFANLTAVNVETVWSKETPKKASGYLLDTDEQENVYVFDGEHGVIKLNSEGVQQWKLSVPVKDAKHELRALVVHPITLDVFVGVSAGGDQKTAELFCYQQTAEGEVETRWAEPLALGGYVKWIELFGGRMHVVVQYPDRNFSRLYVYEAIDSAAPALAWVRDVPSKTNGCVVKDNGEVFVFSEPDVLRGLNPMAPGIYGVLPFDWIWNATHLTDYSQRAYSWLRGDKVNGNEETDVPAEGEELLAAFDCTGNDRNWYAATTPLDGGTTKVQMQAPRMTHHGLGDRASIVFEGLRFKDPTDATKGKLASGMDGLPNNSVQPQYASSARGTIPSFEGGAWYGCVLVRPKVGYVAAAAGGDPAGTDVAADAVMPILAQPNEHQSYTKHTGGFAALIGMFMNRKNGAVLPGTFDSGAACPYDIEWQTGLTPAGITPEADDVDIGTPKSLNAANAVLISFLYNAKANSTAPVPTDNKTFSLWRVNGYYIDRWASPNIRSLLEATLGYVLNPGSVNVASGFFAGEQCEVFIMQRKRDSAGALSAVEPIVLSHPTNAYDQSALPNTATALVGPATIFAPGATWAPPTKRLTLIGAFAAYTWAPNDRIQIVLESGTGTTPGYYFVKAKINNDTIELYESIGAPTGTVNFIILPMTELELLEGSVAWRRGAAQYLAPGHPWKVRPPPPPTIPLDSVRDPARLLSIKGLITKLSANGDLVWVASDDRDSTGAVVAMPWTGVGYGLALSGTTVNDVYKPKNGPSLYSIGPKDPILVGNASVREIVDLGDSYRSFGAVWSQPIGTTPAFTGYPYRLAVDERNNVYVPSWNSEQAGNFSLRIITSAGATILDLDVTSAGNADATTSNSATEIGQSAVAIPPLLPKYPPVFADRRAEFVYLAGAASTFGGTAGQGAVRKLRLVSVTPNSVSPRLLRITGVAAGVINKITTGGVAVPAGIGTLVGAVLDPNARFISSAAIAAKRFFSDGKNLIVYDPELDVISLYKSKTSGQPLKRPSLLAAHDGRLWFLRGYDRPQMWQCTAQGDPFDNDLEPPGGPYSTSATDGVTAPAAFVTPEAINAFFSATRNTALFGLESQIIAMHGNPAQGAIFETVSKSTGMSFGEAHCDDGKGRGFFHGSRGGIFRYAGGAVEEISDPDLRERMQQVDLGLYFLVLVWNSYDRGLHVIPVPFGAENTLLKGWFWEDDGGRGAWWEDSFPPTAWFSAVAYIDGDDPDDRTLLLGRVDSFVSRWSRTAKDDDGFGIKSHVTFGAINSGVADRDVSLEGMQLELAAEQDGVEWQWFVGATAEKAAGGSFPSPSSPPPIALGSPELSGLAGPGLNKGQVLRTGGANLWLRLGNAAPGQRWAFKRLMVDLYAGAERRAV